ncbi:MAG: radical SAM protein [bacterium]|nr:radical SAM protein [bacterium]
MKYNIKKDSYKFSEKKVNSFINIALRVTRNCNLHCVHCCESEKIQELSLDVIKKIIDKLSGGGLNKICITGGEPLLRNDIVEIMQYAHNKKMLVTLSTNGFILNEEKLIEIKPYIDNIRFSLHGTENIHNEIVQNKDGFKRVVESINIATKLGVPVSVVASIFVKNYSTMLDIAKICEKHKVEKLYFFSLISRGRAHPIYDKEYEPFINIKNSFDKISNIAQRESWNLGMNVIDWSLEGQCVLILPDGNVVGVPSFNDKNHAKIVGNILQENINFLWDNYPFKDNYIKYYKNH